MVVVVVVVTLQLQYQVIRTADTTEAQAAAALSDQLKAMFGYASANGEEDRLFGRHTVVNLDGAVAGAGAGAGAAAGAGAGAPTTRAV